MNSKVIKLADLDQFEINPDYKKVDVTVDEIQSLMERMASNLGKTVAVPAIEENCGVVCKSAEGTKVLLYPYLEIAGLEKAASDVKGKSIGDTFTTMLKDEEVTLSVEEILVNRAMSVDDELAKACEIDGVSTLAQLQDYLMAQEVQKKKDENVKMLVMEYVQFIMNNSEVDLDEDEVKEWAIPEAKRVYEEELSFGIDLRFTEEGEMISEEEALDRLAQDLRTQFAVNLLQEQFGKEKGFVPAEGEETMGNPYDIFMYETLTARAKEALS